MGLVFTSVGDQGDPNVRGLAVDTIGFIGGTPEGKGALEKQGVRGGCVGISRVPDQNGASQA